MPILPSSILVLGAGELGLAVLRHLAGYAASFPGVTLSVLLRPATIDSRDAAKQRDLAAIRDLGVSIVAGDLADDSSDGLTALFRPFSTVVSCTGFVGGAGTQLKIARAVLAAGVPRYVPWQFGVDYDVIGRGSAQDLFDEQLDVRDLLRAQARTAWIIISTGLFTSFLFEPSFGVVDLAQNAVHALGGWDNAVTVTAPNDIGKLTAAILFAEPPLDNRVVYTAGDTITYAQVADAVDTVLDRKTQRAEWSVSRLQAELAQDPGDAARKYRVVFAEGRGVAWGLEQTFNAQHGIAVAGLEQWMRENLR